MAVGLEVVFEQRLDFHASPQPHPGRFLPYQSRAGWCAPRCWLSQGEAQSKKRRPESPGGCSATWAALPGVRGPPPTSLPRAPATAPSSPWPPPPAPQPLGVLPALPRGGIPFLYLPNRAWQTPRRHPTSRLSVPAPIARIVQPAWMLAVWGARSLPRPPRGDF